MRGVARCLICNTLTSDWTQIGRWGNGHLYACDDHVAEGRTQLGNLRKSDAAMGNRSAKRSGNPAKPTPVTPTENGEKP